MKHTKIFILVICFMLLITALFADTMDWIIHIKAGLEFRVHFDKTDNKFKNFLKKFPMGFLKGGASYEVYYKDGQYYCTGYHLGKKQNGTWSDSDGEPLDSQISLWGRVFIFDGEGNLYDPEHGLVGHLSR